MSVANLRGAIMIVDHRLIGRTRLNDLSSREFPGVVLKIMTSLASGMIRGPIGGFMKIRERIAEADRSGT